MNSESAFSRQSSKFLDRIAFVIKTYNRNTLDVMRSDVMVVNCRACFVFQRIEML